MLGTHPIPRKKRWPKLATILTDCIKLSLGLSICIKRGLFMLRKHILFLKFCHCTFIDKNQQKQLNLVPIQENRHLLSFSLILAPKQKEQRPNGLHLGLVLILFTMNYNLDDSKKKLTSMTILLKCIWTRGATVSVHIRQSAISVKRGKHHDQDQERSES